MFLRKRNLNKGFTLVELLVTISIFVVLTGVVLFNQSKFNSTILLTNLAYDTGLTIRQAQTYGINIKEFNAGTGGASVFVPYGVHFDISNSTNDKSFILFADTKYVLTDTTKKLTPYSGAVGGCNPADGCVNRYSIKRGNYISDIQVVKGSESPVSVETLDIIFRRPNPDAFIFGKVKKEDTSYTAYDKATIFLMGADDNSVRKVNVQANGLIEIVQ